MTIWQLRNDQRVAQAIADSVWLNAKRTALSPSPQDITSDMLDPVLNALYQSQDTMDQAIANTLRLAKQIHQQTMAQPRQT